MERLVFDGVRRCEYVGEILLAVRRALLKLEEETGEVTAFWEACWLPRTRRHAYLDAKTCSSIHL